MLLKVRTIKKGNTTNVFKIYNVESGERLDVIFDVHSVCDEIVGDFAMATTCFGCSCWLTNHSRRQCFEKIVLKDSRCDKLPTELADTYEREQEERRQRESDDLKARFERIEPRMTIAQVVSLVPEFVQLSRAYGNQDAESIAHLSIRKIAYMGHQAEITLFFLNPSDRLNMMRVDFNEVRSANRNNMYDAYSDLLNHYKKKYGRPIERKYGRWNEIIWLGDDEIVILKVKITSEQVLYDFELEIVW